MKKFLVVSMVLALVMGLSSVSIAAILGSSHDLSGRSWNTTNEDLCNVCHTPHNPGGGTGAPLWGHTVSSGAGFDLYSTGANTDHTPGQPAGVSLLCLSCHDGTVALDSYGGATGSDTLTTASAAFVGKDLSDDHPVSFAYNSTLVTADGELETAATVEASLPLFSGSLECATCHDVHNSETGVVDNGKFLRVSTADSELCRKCHKK